MARPDGRIEPGQRLATAISARAWNRAQQAADVVLGAGTGATGDGSTNSGGPYSSLPFMNWDSSGNKDATRGDIVVTADSYVAVTPTTDDAKDTNQFWSLPILTGTVAGGPRNPASGLAVAVEPIPKGKIGRVAVSGLVQSKVKITHASARYAIPVWDSTNFTFSFQSDFVTGFRIAYASTWSVDSVAYALLDLSHWHTTQVALAEMTSTSYDRYNSMWRAKLLVRPTNGTSGGGQYGRFSELVSSPYEVRVASQNIVGTAIEQGKKVWLQNSFSINPFVLNSKAFSAPGSLEGEYGASYWNYWDVIGVESQVVTLTKTFTTINGTRVVSDIQGLTSSTNANQLRMTIQNPTS